MCIAIHSKQQQGTNHNCGTWVTRELPCHVSFPARWAKTIQKSWRFCCPQQRLRSTVCSGVLVLPDYKHLNDKTKWLTSILLKLARSLMCDTISFYKCSVFTIWIPLQSFLSARLLSLCTVFCCHWPNQQWWSCFKFKIHFQIWFLF